MKKSATLAVVGGDVRQAYLAALLHDDGHEVRVFALERQAIESCPPMSDLRSGLAGVQAVILPMPVQHGDAQLNAPLSNAPHALSAVLDAIPSGTLTLAGAVPFWVHARAVQNELRLLDYLSREELAILNAVPTCEGAIQLAMEQTPHTIQGARCLIIGNGRLGSLLAHKLQVLGAAVTVSARTGRDFAKIFSAGLPSLDTRKLAGHLAEFDLIFNTVPAAVLGAAELSELTPPCLVMDLASLPGGVDTAVAPPEGCRVMRALSLPGRVAPLSAARAVRDTISTMLSEEGVI